MRPLRLFAWIAVAAIVAPPVFAFSTGPKDEPRPATTSSAPGSTESAVSTARQEADRWYGDSYNEIAKANRDVADHKTASAEKRFKKAMEKGEKATALDSSYFEAYNLIGYCARNLRLYDKSLASYERCLKIKPDYAAAREYLGELYVDMGNLDKASEQLAWLEKLEEDQGAATLKTRIDAARAAKPATPIAGASGVTAPAPAAAADTLRTKPPGSEN